MSVNLQKGQKISLKKSDGSGLKKVMVGLGWDEAQPTATGWRALFASSSSILGMRRPYSCCSENVRPLFADRSAAFCAR